MLGALDPVVAPPAQQVPRIHHDRVLDRRRAHKGALRTLDLETADIVLEEQRDRSVVRVLARSDPVGVVCEHALRHGRVVQETESIVAAVGVAVEEVRAAVLQAHAQGDGAHHLHVQVLAGQEERLHGAGEVYAGRVELVGPSVRGVRHTFSPDLHRLLEVGVAGPEGEDLRRVGGLGDFLAAEGHVAAVGSGGGPAEGVLLGLASVEEEGGFLEYVVDCGGWDAVVAEIEESGGLEGLVDGLGGGESGVVFSVQECREVDEL